MKPHVVTVVVVLPLLLAGLCSGCATYTSHPAQPIHIAAEKGDLAGVQAAVARDPKCIEAKGDWGCRPLHMAAEKGRVEVVGYLLEQKANTHARDRLSWTALHRAAYGGQAGTARLLLDAGAGMNVKDRQGFTPLHWAVYESAGLPGATDTAKLLITRGANVNARDTEGSTPLFWAAWQGNKDLVVFLLEHGADQRVRGKEGLTPLEATEKYGSKEMASVLESYATGQGIPLEAVRSRKAEEARRAAAARQGIPKKQASPEEIRATSIEEWFRRLGNDTQLGYTPFSALNALIAKAKEGAESKNEVIRRAMETIDDRKGSEVKRWQCCYVLSGTRDPSVIPALTRALGNRSEIVRGVAACALGALDDAAAKSALEAAAKTEKSREVVSWIQRSLKGEFRKAGAGGNRLQDDGA